MATQDFKGALVAIVVTLLFPPFQIHAPNSIFGLGYGFLLSPPKFNAVYGTVDVPLLLAEWLAGGVICGILWVLKRDPVVPKSEEPKKPDVTWR
ncbi:MAG: hypothetical protein NT159_05845 [Proteobacteria bacterium]|nr:hypothetical protein [Pseudomonadota bacterium]